MTAIATRDLEVPSADDLVDLVSRAAALACRTSSSPGLTNRPTVTTKGGVAAASTAACCSETLRGLGG